MIKDYRPYIIKKAYLKFQRFYVLHFIKPQLDFLGNGFVIMRPWYIEFFGGPIKIGKFATIIAASDKKIRFSVWPNIKKVGYINIGNYCIISPGVRISSAVGIDIGESCMIANNVYITDSDWHGVYDRVSYGESSRVKLEDNVWIGDSAIICKGVTIGENSVIGAGSVVVNSVLPNVIVAGNPAKVVKKLDVNKKIISRKNYYLNPKKLREEYRKLEKISLHDNTLLSWIKHLFFPSKKN